MDYKYDLAISLLDEDAQIGWDIVNGLGNQEKIFFYKKNVDELTFKNGVNVFGDVFSKQARFVLVLFRENYGNTDWTGLEYALIQERYKKTIKGGASPILFCKLDSSATPSWLIDSYIYHKLNGVDELITLLRKMINDHGGTSFPQTAEERLKQKIKTQKYEESFQQRSLINRELADEARSEAASLREKLFDKLNNNATKNGLFFKDNSENYSDIIPIASMNVVFGPVTVFLMDHQEATNSIQKAYVEVILHKDGKIKKHYKQKYYKTINGIPGWRNTNLKGFVSSSEFVEIIFNDLINII